MTRQEQIKAACDGLAEAVSMMKRLHFEEKERIFRLINELEGWLMEGEK